MVQAIKKLLTKKKPRKPRTKITKQKEDMIIGYGKQGIPISLAAQLSGVFDRSSRRW